MKQARKKLRVFQLPALSIHLSSASNSFSVFTNFFILIFGVIQLFLTAISNSRILLYLLNCIIFSFTGSNYVGLSFKFFLHLSDCLKTMASLFSSGTVLNYPREVSAIYYDCLFLCMYFNLGNFLGMTHFAFCTFCTMLLFLLATSWVTIIF